MAAGELTWRDYFFARDGYLEMFRREFERAGTNSSFGKGHPLGEDTPLNIVADWFDDGGQPHVAAFLRWVAEEDAKRLPGEPRPGEWRWCVTRRPPPPRRRKVRVVSVDRGERTAVIEYQFDRDATALSSFTGPVGWDVLGEETTMPQRG